MSTYTNWYHLDKYEGQDKPNLLDQYNSAMDKIDYNMHQIALNGGGSIPADVEQRLETLEEDVNSISEDIASIETPSNNPYSGKKIAFFGDSYTYGTGASDHLSGDTKRYSSLLASWLGMQELNYAVGGTGWCYSGNNMNKDFNQQIVDASAALSTAEKNDVYLVIIAGGINDTRVNDYTYTQMYNAATTATNTAYNTFPNAKILIVPMLYQGFQFTYKARVLYDAIVNAMHKINKRNVYVMEGCYTWNWGDRTHFANDKLHPNDLGHETIAKNVLHGIFGELTQWENYIYNINFGENFEPAQNETNSGTVKCTISIKEGIVYIKPLRILPSVAVTENTVIASIPKSCAPENNAYIQLNRANNVIGCAAVAFNSNIYINPNIDPTALPADNSFYISPTTYALYGSDYQN